MYDLRIDRWLGLLVEKDLASESVSTTSLLIVITYIPKIINCVLVAEGLETHCRIVKLMYSCLLTRSLVKLRIVVFFHDMKFIVINY